MTHHDLKKFPTLFQGHFPKCLKNISTKCFTKKKCVTHRSGVFRLMCLDVYGRRTNPGCTVMDINSCLAPTQIWCFANLLLWFFEILFPAHVFVVLKNNYKHFISLKDFYWQINVIYAESIFTVLNLKKRVDKQKPTSCDKL